MKKVNPSTVLRVDTGRRLGAVERVKTRILTYTAMFTKEPEGGYTVVVPALQGCVTYGKSFEDAKAMAEDAIQAYLESLAKHGEKAPIESQPVSVAVSVTVPKDLHLYA